MSTRWLVVAAGLTAFACTRSKDERREDPRPAQSAREVPVTTTSAEALRAFEKGRELAENFRFSEALPDLRKAVELDPGFALAHAYLAMLSKGPEREDHERRAVAASPRLSEPERLLIRMAVARGCNDVPEAHGLLRRLAGVAPDDWRVQTMLGGMSFHSDNWEESVAALRKAIELNPHAGEPYNQLGYALAYQGRFEEATQAIQRYAAMKPEEPNPQDSLGEILMMAGRLEEAEAAFRRAAALSSKFWRAWVGVAVSRFARRDWEGGREAMMRAREAATLPAEKLEVDAKLAIVLAAQRKDGEALRALDAIERRAKELRLDGERASVPVTRAWFLSELGQGERALQELSRALELAKTARLLAHERTRLEYKARHARAVIAARLGRIAEAEKELGVVRELSPKVSDKKGRDALHLASGVLAAAKGDGNAAVRHLSRCRAWSTQCLAELAQVQEHLGDAAGAAETRARVRQSVYRDMPYVYFREKLERASTARVPPLR